MDRKRERWWDCKLLSRVILPSISLHISSLFDYIHSFLDSHSDKILFLFTPPDSLLAVACWWTHSSPRGISGKGIQNQQGKPWPNESVRRCTVLLASIILSQSGFQIGIKEENEGLSSSHSLLWVDNAQNDTFVELKSFDKNCLGGGWRGLPLEPLAQPPDKFAHGEQPAKSGPGKHERSWYCVIAAIWASA